MRPYFQNWRLLLTALCTLLYIQSWGQVGQIQGKITNSESQNGVSGATVRLNERSIATDTAGLFSFEKLPAGDYTLHIHALGYHPFLDNVTKTPSEDLWLHIALTPQSDAIEAVTVRGQSEAERIKKAPIRAVFIDTRAVSTQAISLTDLMNKSAGIRVRQSGGMGSRPELSINGFQGKAIKYFKDGIPLDHLGEGFNLSSLPVEMLDHIEVYKGVLPARLGADALGGAVNLVQDQSAGNRARAFYEVGSFNTHRLGVTLGRNSSDEKWRYGAEAFFNHSDNDYKALLEVVNPETRHLEERRLPLFHNAYTHFMGDLYGSFTNRNWAEELRFSVSGFAINREQQHPALMTDPYGAVQARQRTLVPALRYKHRLFDNRFIIDHYSSYNNLQSQRIDTLQGRYNWYGEYTPGSNIGESRLPSQSQISERQFVARTYFGYRLSPASRLEFNHVFTSADRDGSDPLGPRVQNSENESVDVLSITSQFQKHIFGLSLEQYFLQEKLHNQLMVKHYRYRAAGLQNTWLSSEASLSDFTKTANAYWGATEAVKYQFSTDHFIRAALEFTYRLPEREELFGNNVFLVPNFELKPERSLNANLGYHAKIFDRLTAEINGFYRRTENLILLVPIQAPNAQYQNEEHVRGYGFDVDLSFPINPQYAITANATWQDLRLFGITHAQEVWKNNARLRNTPYFFANLGWQGKFKDMLSSGDKLQTYLHYHFTREFYLETIPQSLEPGGILGLIGSANINSNLLIPNQHLLSAGFDYGLTGERLHIGAECRNVLDADSYDYYRIQRPGRSFHLKLSYKL